MIYKEWQKSDVFLLNKINSITIHNDRILIKSNHYIILIISKEK